MALMVHGGDSSENNGGDGGYDAATKSGGVSCSGKGDLHAQRRNWSRQKGEVASLHGGDSGGSGGGDGGWGIK